MVNRVLLQLPPSITPGLDVSEFSLIILKKFHRYAWSSLISWGRWLRKYYGGLHQLNMYTPKCPDDSYTWEFTSNVVLWILVTNHLSSLIPFIRVCYFYYYFLFFFTVNLLLVPELSTLEGVDCSLILNHFHKSTRITNNSPNLTCQNDNRPKDCIQVYMAKQHKYYIFENLLGHAVASAQLFMPMFQGPMPQCTPQLYQYYSLCTIMLQIMLT